MNFVETPNLPNKKVKVAIIADFDCELTEFVKSFGINLLFTDKNSTIDSAIAFHADVNCFYLGSGKIITDNSQLKLTENLKLRNFTVINPEKPVFKAYPNDCRLNCAAIGSKLIAKHNSADSEILKKFSKENILNVRQGYAKCSVAIVNENAIITDDASIHSVCIKNGIDAILIGKGSVCLPGHNYGFIGGACGLIDKNKMIFFGDITNHSDYLKISDFLEKQKCEFFYLHKHVLTDIGGMIAIEEE